MGETWVDEARREAVYFFRELNAFATVAFVFFKVRRIARRDQHWNFPCVFDSDKD